MNKNIPFVTSTFELRCKNWTIMLGFTGQLYWVDWMRVKKIMKMIT